MGHTIGAGLRSLNHGFSANPLGSLPQKATRVMGGVLRRKSGWSPAPDRKNTQTPATPASQARCAGSGFNGHGSRSSSQGGTGAAMARLVLVIVLPGASRPHAEPDRMAARTRKNRDADAPVRPAHGRADHLCRSLTFLRILADHLLGAGPTSAPHAGRRARRIPDRASAEGSPGGADPCRGTHPGYPAPRSAAGPAPRTAR